MSVKKHPFTIGFWVTLLLFITINILSAHLLSDCGLLGALNLAGCSDDISRAGFPLPVWEEGGFIYHQSFDGLALLINLVIALSVSVAVGLAGHWWSKRAKSYQPTQFSNEQGEE